MSSLAVDSAEVGSCDVSLDTTLSSSPSDNDDNTSEDSGANDVSSSLLGSLYNILTFDKREKAPPPELLRSIFKTFLDEGIYNLTKSDILAIDKKDIVGVCRDIKVRYPQVWSKSVAKLLGAVLKAISTVKLQVLRAPEEPIEGSFVEAYWANKSWCCGQIAKIHYYNSDGSVCTPPPLGTIHATSSGASVATHGNGADFAGSSTIVKYDISYLDSSVENDVGRDRIRLLDDRAKLLAGAVQKENYSLLFHYMKEFQNDANTERIGCGLMALIVYSPEWRQSIGDSHKIPLLEMGAGKILISVIRRNSNVPYYGSDINEATDEIKNSVAAIDKALRALYNFTFHLVHGSQEFLIRSLVHYDANEVVSCALNAFPHVRDIQRWGRLTLQRLNYPMSDPEDLEVEDL